MSNNSPTQSRTILDPLTPHRRYDLYASLSSPAQNLLSQFDGATNSNQQRELFASLPGYQQAQLYFHSQRVEQDGANFHVYNQLERMAAAGTNESSPLGILALRGEFTLGILREMLLPKGLNHRHRKQYRSLFKELQNERTGAEEQSMVMSCVDNVPALLRAVLEIDNIDVNQVSTDGNSYTALSQAVFNNDSTSVELLVRHEGIDLNHQNTTGMAPLFMAASRGNAKIVKLLLEQKDVEINLKSNDGASALSIASQEGNTQVVALISKRSDADLNNVSLNGIRPLYVASQNGHTSVVRILTSKPSCEINSFWTENKLTALSIAAHNGHLKVVKVLLQREDILVNAASESDQETALMKASKGGHSQIVQLLVARLDVDLNVKSKEGCTALFYAACRDSSTCMENLLSNQACDVNILCTLSTNDQTALSLCCSIGHDKCVRALLQRTDIEVNKKVDADNLTPLSWAAFNGHVRIVEMMAARPDVDLKAALFQACCKGQTEVVKVLVSKPSCDINFLNIPDTTKPTSSITALEIAAYCGYENCVKFLLQRYDIDVSKTNQDKQTALICACAKGHHRIVRRLLKYVKRKGKEEINAKSTAGYSALWYASSNGHSRTVRLLLNVPGINVNDTENLYISCQNGHYSTAKLLLENATEININKNSKVGAIQNVNTLVISSVHGHIKCVKLLLQQPNIDVNKYGIGSNGSRLRPLWVASQNGHSNVVRALLTCSAIDVNLYSSGASALYLGCQNGHIKCVRLLLQHHSIDINIGRNSVRPLVISCQFGHCEVVKLLLSHHGVDCNHGGLFALYVACLKGHADIVKILLRQDTILVNQPYTTSTETVTPFMVAVREGHTSIVEMLLKYGVEPDSEIHYSSVELVNGRSFPLKLARTKGKSHEDIVQLLVNYGSKVEESSQTDGCRPLC